MTLCLHLLFHGILNLTRRDDVFKLDAVNLNAPWVGCFVKNNTYFCIYGITRCKRCVKLHLTYDITKRGCREIFNSRNRMFNTVCVKLGVGYLKEHNRIYLHSYVILGDNGLRCDFNVKSGLPRRKICTESRDNICF